MRTDEERASRREYERKRYTNDEHRERIRAYQRQYHQDHKEHQAQRRREMRQERYDYVNARKADPCTDCERTFPVVCMQFDHVIGEKIADLSNLCAQGAEFERIQAEIDKCELVCANCHFIRSATRGGWHSAPCAEGVMHGTP